MKHERKLAHPHSEHLCFKILYLKKKKTYIEAYHGFLEKNQLKVQTLLKSNYFNILHKITDSLPLKNYVLD